MNILIIDNSIDITGALTSISNKAYDLKEKHQFYFLLNPNDKVRSMLKDKGFEILNINFIEISRNLKNLVFYFPMLIINAWLISKIVANKKIDIVHANDLFNMAPLLAKCFKKFKLLTHIRRMPESFPKTLYNFWVKMHVKYSDAIVPVSIANSEIFRNHHKVKVIYNPLPFNERWSTYTVDGNSSDIRILYLANYIEGKGQNHLVESLNILNINRKLPNLKVTLAGSDMGLGKNKRYKKKIIELSKHYNLSENMEFMDYVEDTEKLMKSHDISLNFSDSESLSRVSMESLYYGIPLIATDVGGTNELLIDGYSGILVPKGDHTAMAEAIYNLSCDKRLRSQLSEKAKQFVREKFSTKNTSFELGKLYEKLIIDRCDRISQL